MLRSLRVMVLLLRYRVLLAALVVFGVGAGVHGLFHVLDVPTRMPRPWLSAIPWLLACVGIAATLASTATVVRRAKPMMRKIGLGLLHVVVALGGLAGVLAADPSFPFGPTIVEWSTLPDDRGTAYLYKDGMFCQQMVWVARPWQWWSERQPDLTRYTCEQEGHLRWDAERSRVLVVGGDGEPLPRDRALLEGFGEGLDWRPH